MASGHQPGNVIVNYKECRRNYAASFGSHAVDGCRQFLAAGEQGTEEEFLCEACGCHRSFHRKEVIKDGVIHTTPPLPAGPPLFPPPAAAVAMVPMVPYMVLHQPVDHNDNSSPVSGVSHPDFDEDESEHKPNVNKSAKMERL